MNLTTRLIRATVRQALIGLAVAGATLPLVLWLNRTLGLATPPVEGMLLLVGAVSLGFAGGGLLGVVIAAALGGSRARVRLLASFGGLIWASSGVARPCPCTPSPYWTT